MNIKHLDILKSNKNITLSLVLRRFRKNIAANKPHLCNDRYIEKLFQNCITYSQEGKMDISITLGSKLS